MDQRIAKEVLCYMYIQWTPVLYSVETKRQFNPPISQFNVCVMDSGHYSYTIHNHTLSGEFRCILDVRQGESL